MNEDYILQSDIRDFVQAEVDRQSGIGINRLVVYQNNTIIDVAGGQMEKEDWIDMGNDVAEKVKRKFNKVFELAEFDRFGFVLTWERDLTAEESYI